MQRSFSVMSPSSVSSMVKISKASCCTCLGVETTKVKLINFSTSSNSDLTKVSCGSFELLSKLGRSSYSYATIAFGPLTIKTKALKTAINHIIKFPNYFITVMPQLPNNHSPSNLQKIFPLARIMAWHFVLVSSMMKNVKLTHELHFITFQKCKPKYIFIVNIKRL